MCFSRMRNVPGFVSWFFSLISLFFTNRVIYADQRVRAKKEMEQLAAEISDLQKQVGKVPTNEADLQQQLKRPWHSSPWYKHIEYSPMGTNHFGLTIFSPWPDWEIFEYYSEYPEVGVTITRF